MKSTMVKEFLSDMQTYARIECLEEGKEKNELLESAKKRGILVDPNFGDMGIIKTIFGFTDKPSGNGQILVEEKLLKVLPQIVGRPMNKDHVRKMILGSYIDYKYIAKKKQIIAYATFYRSVYPELWEKTKKFQKLGKLSSSFEIFAPKNLRKYIDDKNYELNGMAMIGGALVYEEKGTRPAFADAKVLEMACCKLKGLLSDECLECATKYTDDEIIIATSELAPVVAPVVAPVIAPVSTITCQNCKEAFTPGTIGELKLTCPSCKAIVDPSGMVLLPPQVKDYHLSCPECSGSFTILEAVEDHQNVQCDSCGKKYVIEFDMAVKSDVLELVGILYEAEINCPQCGHKKPINTFVDAEPFEVECDKCKMKFPVNIKNKKIRKIKKISLLKEDTKKQELEDEEVEKAKLIKGIKKLANEVMKLKKEKKLKNAVSYDCECIKCGHKEKSTKHCKDIKCSKCGGQMRRAERPGVGRGVEKATLRLNKVLMIARELKGKLKEAFGIQSLKDSELAYTIEEAKKKDVIIGTVKSEVETATKQVKFYKDNAFEILTRKEKLGDFAKDMSDEEILDEKDYEIATLKKQAAEKSIDNIETATDLVGSKKQEKVTDDYAAKVRAGVNKVAFGE